MGGDPDAAYNLPPESQARLLGYLLSRNAPRSDPGGKGSKLKPGDPQRLGLNDILARHWGTSR